MIVSCRCIICLSDFQYDHAGRGRRRRFCSDPCRTARHARLNEGYRREGRYERREPKPRVPSIPKVCAVCNKAFLAVDRKRQACGPACGGVLAKRHGDAGRRRNAEERRRRICKACGVPFVMRNPSGRARSGLVNEGKFCGRRCARSAQTIACEAVR